MGKKWTYINTAGEDRKVWDRLCPSGEYRVLPPTSLPVVIPSGLLSKADSVLVVSSGSPQGTTLVMVNIHRVDARAGAIDQEPFGIIFHGDAPAISGCLLHHGGWSDRTTSPPQAFWDAVAASGVGGCYPFSEIPNNAAGPISELKVSSQHAAFSTLVSQLKDCLTSGGETT